MPQPEPLLPAPGGQLHLQAAHRDPESAGGMGLVATVGLVDRQDVTAFDLGQGQGKIIDRRNGRIRG